VGPHVVPVGQLERLVQPPVGQGTLGLSNPEDQHGLDSDSGRPEGKEQYTETGELIEGSGD
jgi:hypothetical protein